MNSRFLNSEQVKAEALRLGFSACGVAEAKEVGSDHAAFFLRWIASGRGAGMDYMGRNTDMRLRPSLLVSGVQSIVSVALNYRPPRPVPGLSLYAQGRDYHEVMREKMGTLMERIGGSGRCFTDTAPVLERYWAWQAGVGWIGRNTLLYVPGVGSTVFLGELFLLEKADSYDHAFAHNCGTCHKCAVSCPQHALGAHGLDARRCQSYRTIEQRGEWSDGFRPAQWFYGCDCCQEVCPRQGDAIGDEAFYPSSSLQQMTPEEWKSLTVERYRQLFKGSAVKRAKYEGLMRNIKAFFTIVIVLWVASCLPLP